MNHSPVQARREMLSSAIERTAQWEGPRSGEPVFPVNPKAEKIGRRITEPNDINESYTTLI